MTDLRERLHESVADAVPVGDGWDGLWVRGRRVRRRRHAGGVAAAAAVVLVVLAAVTGLPRAVTSAPPVTSHPDRLGIPRDFPAPSGWENVAHAGDPVGPMAAVVQADRKRVLRLPASGQLLAVSAVDGRYTFLDLPDAALSTDTGPPFALSPDGTRLAYWTHDREGRIRGFAVYDALNGTVSHVPMRSPLGLSNVELAWFGNSRTLFIEAAEIQSVSPSESVSNLLSPELWTAQGFRPAPSGLDPSASVIGPARQGLALIQGQVLLRLQPDGELTEIPRDWTNLNPQSAAVSPNGSQIAMDGQRGSTIHATAPLVVAKPGFDSSVSAVAKLAPRVSSVVGWTGPHRVAITAPSVGDGLVTVDLRTGATYPYVAYSTMNLPTLATGLMTRPTIGPGHPAMAFDQAWLLLLLPVVGLSLLWRRRARR